jgi:hypothetical protein
LDRAPLDRQRLAIALERRARSSPPVQLATIDIHEDRERGARVIRLGVLGDALRFVRGGEQRTIRSLARPNLGILSKCSNSLDWQHEKLEADALRKTKAGRAATTAQLPG